MPELDADTIRHALQVARRHGVSEIELESGENRFSALLSHVASPPRIAPAGQAAVEVSSDAVPDALTIQSPCVGFYRPVDSIFVAGGKLEKGQIVATIEALGLANDVESPVDGEVQEVLVEPNQPVEYGQILATVKSL